MPLTVPSTAPFSGPQKMWLKGYLDAINSALSHTPGSPPAATAAPLPAGIAITILWGSQTGNAEGLGKKLSKTLTAKGHQPTLLDMAAVTVADLSVIDNLLVITSTYGDGEPPDNAAALHAALHAADAPSLSSVRYSVLALGDSSYPDFCKCGHDFDKQLAALGASRITPIAECDVDFEKPFAAWISQIETTLAAATA